MIAAAPVPIQSVVSIATRPASHNKNKTRSGMPWSGKRPVQFGIAVKRKPVGVPSNYAVTGGEVPETGEKSNPQHHGDAGPQRRTEEEQPEAVTQQRDCLRPKSGNTARPGTAVFAHPT